MINRAALSCGERLKQIHQDITTMDTVTEDFARSDVDAEMTVLTPEDITEQNIDAGDEVENLRNRWKSATIILNIIFWIYYCSEFSVWWDLVFFTSMDLSEIHFFHLQQILRSTDPTVYLTVINLIHSHMKGWVNGGICISASDLCVFVWMYECVLLWM